MTAQSRPLRIGLTGGIGSGKSTVGQMLASRGAAVIDADAIARSVTQPHGLAMPAIEKTFGQEFVGADGALDRERMRAYVFANAQAKQALEAIIHPLVAQETQRVALAATQSGHHTLVFDVPLLVEAGARWRAQVDRVLVVDCSVETQIQRVMARNGFDRKVVENIISNQASRSQRLAAADWVIDNDHLTMDRLAASVLSLALPL
jgi:dephospho-CoA kinase